MNRWLVLILAIVPLVFLLIAIMPDVVWQKYEFSFKDENFEKAPKNTVEKSLWKHDTLYYNISYDAAKNEISYPKISSKGNIFGDSDENICSDIRKGLTNCCDPHLYTQYTFVGAIAGAGVTLLLAVLYAVFGKNKLLLHAYALFALISGALAVTTIALWDEHMGTHNCGLEELQENNEELYDKQKTSLELGFISAAIGAAIYIFVGFLSFYYAQRSSPLPGVKGGMMTQNNPAYNLQSLVF
tara:strand:- start:3014 stop:3739 length:726 start_codon:yes stop_codon:yes gene_type:complete